MDSVSGAVSLARALLALRRSAQSGILCVHSELGSCRLAIEAGLVRAASELPGSDDALGDALLRAGALDVCAHRRALAGVGARGPVGQWLVETGLASRAAVEVALRWQVRERVLRVLACQRIDYRFEAGSASVDAPLIEEPTASADLVLVALRARLAFWSCEQQRAVIAPGELRLNPVGRAIIRDAALWPEEAVAATLLSRGASLVQVMCASRGAARALCFLAALALLAALSHELLEAQRFGLLLRKRDQMRRALPARELLDLPKDAAPSDARRALRRLARRLHPDALGPDADPALRMASSEILRALIDAERELRAG